MKISLRTYADTDFLMVSQWWKRHHGNEFRPSYPSRSAFIVQVDGEDAAFFSMHPMDCDFCYLGFPMGNPDVSREKRNAALDFIPEAAKMWAMQAGIPIVYISIRGERFLNRLRKAGYMEAESGNTHMFAKVGTIA